MKTEVIPRRRGIKDPKPAKQRQQEFTLRILTENQTLIVIPLQRVCDPGAFGQEAQRFLDRYFPHVTAGVSVQLRYDSPIGVVRTYTKGLFCGNSGHWLRRNEKTRGEG